MSENAGNANVQEQPVSGKGRKSNSRKLSNVEFTALCIRANTENDPLEVIMKESGLSASSVSAKRSSLRAKGYPIPNFIGRGGEGGVKEMTAEDLKLLSELTKRPVEDLKKESEMTIEQVQARSVAVKSGRAANKGQQTAPAGQAS